MSSPSFYSQAGNFIDTVNGGVDPRTGLYNVSLSLANLHTCALAGPALMLSLNYSPLSLVNEGFGTGFALGLTRYDSSTRKLKLFTGEVYGISSSGNVVNQRRIRHFIFKKIDDNTYQVIHKTGLTEYLSRLDSVYVPTKLVSPDGRNIQFEWNTFQGQPRLQCVNDSIESLLSVTYPNGSVAITTLSVLPDNADSGYKVEFEFSNVSHLVKITSNAATPSLIWTFDYDNVGPARVRAITGVSQPTGLKETVSYFSDRGMAFPDRAGKGVLPCVFKHTIMPGGSQPDLVTEWEWTPETYLGRGAGEHQWEPDADYMMQTLLPNFCYGSTARMRMSNTDTILSSVTRRYNSYHLQISESTLRAGKTFRLITKYYARSGMAFDEQPLQYNLPVSQTEIWEDGNGNQLGKHVTRWQFDEAGNPLRQRGQDGTVTKYVYYPVQGEGDNCPAAPHGFAYYLKSKTVIPSRLSGNEPVTKTVTTWKKQEGLFDNILFMVVDKVTETTGSVKTVVTREYYDDKEGILEFGREKKRTTILTPDVSVTDSFTSQWSFTYQLTEQGVRQSETFTGHDGLTAKHSTLRHRNLGHLLSKSDMQDVVTTFTYDKLGRPLTRIMAPETDYKRTTRWSYSIEKDGQVTLETDAAGNQTKTYYDGAGREITQQRLDVDGETQQWFEISSQSYNALGEISSNSVSDWLTGSSKHYRLGSTFAYDGWGILSSRMFSDGTTSQQVTDMGALTQTISVSGGAGPKERHSGTLKTQLSQSSRLPLTETWYDTSGKVKGVRAYEWDGLGRLLKNTDEMDISTEMYYDSLGRVLKQTTPDGRTVKYKYAGHLTGNQVTSVSVTRDSDGVTWELGTQEFDSLGRITKHVCGGRVTLNAYRGSSPFPCKVTLPSGSVLEYEYIPEMGNVLKSMKMQGGEEQTFLYNVKTGSLLEASGSGTRISNTINSSGSLKAESFAVGGDIRTTGYTRTLAGEVETYKDVAGKKIRYNLDSFGRLISVQDAELTACLGYDALGRLHSQSVKSTEYDTTLTTLLTYDDFGREITRSITYDNNTLKITQSWQYNGLLDSRSTALNSKNIRHEQYIYDFNNRLSQYIVHGLLKQQDAYGYDINRQVYQYDVLNNLTSVTTTLLDETTDIATYHYRNVSDPTQLTSVTHTHKKYPKTIELQYDANGCMTRDEAGRILSYDAMGRLTGVNGSCSYSYDSLSRLVKRSTGASSRLFYYRAEELVNVALVPENKTARLIKIGKNCLGVNDGSSIKLTGVDHHESLLFSEKIDKTDATQYTWSAYGSGKKVDLLPGFNGELIDSVSGTYLLGNGYRAYNPVLMRFNCPDSLSPFGGGGINPYAYCAGDPINYTDPSGHISGWGIAAIVLGGVGLTLTVFAAVGAIAAAGGVMAALSSASTTTLVVGGLGVVSDVTAIASGAMEESNPEASSALGWASLGTGAAAMAVGLGSFARKAFGSSQKGTVVLGGNMKNLDSLGNDIYLFDDIYKQGSRLNVVAHGVLQADNTGLLARTVGNNMNATEIFNVLNTRKNLTGYTNIRTIMCHSGSGGSMSFGQQLANLSGLPVKSYRGRVTGNFEVHDLNKLLLETVVKHGDEGFEYLQKAFSQKYAYKIYKVNPHGLVSSPIKYATYNYDPVKFYPS